VPLRVSAFVSPHGFGHAARASAVLSAVHRRFGSSIDLFTTAPEWFFEESLPRGFRHHGVLVDVGFSQKSALEHDTAATVAALQRLIPFEPERIESLAEQVRASGSHVVLCDIAPLGVAVAERAGVPSVLVENFSWSWLYEPLLDEAPELGPVSDFLAGWVERATVHLQARPVCERLAGLELVDPISREPRLLRADARAALGLPEDGPVVVVTMGGHDEEMPFLERLRGLDDFTFVVTGSRRSGVRGNLVLFDNATPLYMPDVLAASDAVVAKLGYGMVSEVWRAGIPFAGVTRPDSREMTALESFVAEELTGFILDRGAFAGGEWIDRLPELVALPRHPRAGGGADRVAVVLGEVGGAAAA